MKLIYIAAIASWIAVSQVMANNVAFNVATGGAACGSGTTISCSLSPGKSCKGNFNPKQSSIVITQALGKCHVSLYPQNDQHGGVIQRLNTGQAGKCVSTSVAQYQSYGIYC